MKKRLLVVAVVMLALGTAGCGGNSQLTPLEAAKAGHFISFSSYQQLQKWDGKFVKWEFKRQKSAKEKDKKDKILNLYHYDLKVGSGFLSHFSKGNKDVLKITFFKKDGSPITDTLRFDGEGVHFVHFINRAEGLSVPKGTYKCARINWAGGVLELTDCLKRKNGKLTKKLIKIGVWG